MFSFWIVFGMVIVVVFLATGVGFAYKMIARGKRLINSRSTAAVNSFGSVRSVMELPGADRLPPNVQVQMIINWIQKFHSDHVNGTSKRLDRVLKRLDDLEKFRHKADLAMRFEMGELAKVKQKLVHQGIDHVCISTQTKLIKPGSAQTRLKDPTDHSKKKKQVRFKMPVIWTKKTIIDHRFFKTILLWFRRMKRCLEIIWLVVNYLIIRHLRKPAALRKVATKIAHCLSKLLNIKTAVNLKNDTTTVQLEICSFIPCRSGSG